MKTRITLPAIINCLFLCIPFVPGIINSANAQQNFYSTLLTTSPLPETFDNTSTSPFDIDTTTSACNGGNTFWGIESNTGILKEFDLTNNVITYTGNYVPSCGGLSLGISNNLNGGAMSPAFYTSQGSNVVYWDGGNTWTTVPGTAPVPLYNCSGNGNNLYYYSPGATTEIIKYDGSVFTTIFSTTKLMGCADIAVDNNGNFVFVSGIGAMSDSIFIISGAGQILQRYPLTMNVGNAYGCFLLNSVFYIALGSGNSVFPNSLIPVTFTGSNVIVSPPVFLPAGTVLTADLASCNPGTLLGINQLPGINEITIAPNPAVYKITISGIEGNDCKYAVYDAAGRVVIAGEATVNGSASIDISMLNRGAYFVELKTQDEVIRRRFYKM
ncbi:MAG TPA: T9SS type A sorting domain-containing protein [Bacteroidia bacterium]|nr:T9SS type A sorting domain-containing protein [Bacteroidia bacterium]